MPEAVETVVAESSPAAVEAPATPAAPQVDPLQEGPMVTWTREQRDHFRSTGKMPEAPKADSAPAAKPTEAPAESAAESETAKQQEHTETRTPPKPKQTAEERIAQLEATIEKIKKGAGIERTAKPESSTTEPAPKQESKPAQTQNFDQWFEAFDDQKWMEDYAKDHPAMTYERLNLAMKLHVDSVRDGFKQRDEQAAAQTRAINSKLDEAKSRYGNEANDVIQDFAGEIIDDKAMPGVILEMIRDSEYSADLLYVIGSKPEERNRFRALAKSDPGKAIRYLVTTEVLIGDELAAKAKPAASQPAPAKQQTSAPKPPAEVGGRASAPGDALVAAAAAGDFRTFKAELNRRKLAGQ